VLRQRMPESQTMSATIGGPRVTVTGVSGHEGNGLSVMTLTV